MKKYRNLLVLSFVLGQFAMLDATGAAALAPLRVVSHPLKSVSLQTGQSVAPPSQAADTEALAKATVGVAVSTNIVPTAESNATYQWSIVKGSLAPGLTMDSAGLITGTPTTAGSWNAVARSTSRISSPLVTVDHRVKMVIVAAPLTLASSSPLSNAEVGVAYTADLQASGGTPDYTWSVSSGSLPDGLKLSRAGVISGTPTAAGNSSFTVSLKDSSKPAQVQAKSLTLTVTAALAIDSKTLSGAQVGAAYTASLLASGGTPSYTWSVSAGSLPAGLSLSSAGVISGTPTAAGNSSFTVSLKDSANPAQTKTKSLALAVTASALTITSATLGSAQAGAAYSTSLQASGGTPSYTWSVSAGSLPAGLSLSSAGVISGTPTAAGSSSFTVAVKDSSNPAQVQTVATAITVAAAATSPYTTWFIRPDGGSRYSANIPTGQCDGKADVAYPGSGVNQHCAFNDVRYMWASTSTVNNGWVMNGGDTLVIRGCSALSSQQNPDAPHCRIGWDSATGANSQYFCSAAMNSQYGCSMPPPPSGTADHHTRILGGCAYGTYNCNPVIGYPYTNNNLTQLFAGFYSNAVMFINGTQFLDIEGLEITSHNGQCTTTGSPAYPAPCATSAPYSDSSQWGIIPDQTTTDILLQDVYIHGFTAIGMGGPVGGAWNLNRVSIDFNAFAGWNFDSPNHTPFPAGTSIQQSYVTMVGNGCLEEYPITHTQFPAKSCWDSNSAGFGDSWSGQDSSLDTFTCDHCQILYNVKDGAMGPHTLIHNLSLTNSKWVGNMGQSGKWGQDTGANFLFQNNLILGNCLRMSDTLPGAAQNFNQATGLVGSYLTNFCRAAGDVFDYFAGPGTTANFENNTIVTYQPTIFDLGCYPSGSCANMQYTFTDNVMLGYTVNYFDNPVPPGLYYINDSSVQAAGSYNVEYGIRNGDACATNGNICADPLLGGEPAQGDPQVNTTLDGLNWTLSLGSPVIKAGGTYAGAPVTDFFGNVQSTPLTIGAVAP